MNAVARNCCSETVDPCCALPPEFVRLRYFFGQRLGVVDFSDEQSYHIGKLRFHNRHLHGAGVLCGLHAERFVFPQGAPSGTPTTVLRLSRGAALDGCGREIVVGSDQCIDVNAWFQVNRSREEIKEWTLPGEHRVCVALRYRDCPSDPMPAPRDPCGCGPSGCEYGRVRESFELALLTESEQPLCTTLQSPSLADIEQVLEQTPGVSAPGTERVLEAVHRVVAQGCADTPLDSWLCLACFTIVIDAAGMVTDITEPDNEGSGRLSLLPTSVLQQLLIESLAGSAGSGTLGPHPQISAVTFTSSGPDSGTLNIGLELISEGSPAAPVPLAEGTLDPSFVQVHRYDEATFQWAPVTTTVAYDGAIPAVVLTWAAGALAAGERYRISLNSPPETPVIDRKMRTLSPASFTTQLRLIDGGAGALVTAPTLF